MTAGALKAGFAELEKNLLAETEKYYGDRLVSLVLFGSAARGTQRFDSDVDFLIVAKDLPRGRMNRVREYMRVEQALEPFMRAMRVDGINTYLSPASRRPRRRRREVRSSSTWWRTRRSSSTAAASSPAGSIG